MSRKARQPAHQAPVQLVNGTMHNGTTLSRALLNEVYIQQTAPDQIPMPNLPLTDDDINQLAHYLTSIAHSHTLKDIADPYTFSCATCPDLDTCPDAFTPQDLHFTNQEVKRLVLLRLYRAYRFG